MEATVTCSNCIEPIATWCFQCNVCCDLKLCISCFRCGAELGSHQRIHSYRVRVIDSPVVFLPDDDKLLHEPWTLKEELRLLETVEAFNLGDWQDVQKCINPKRTAEEISCHYEDCYLNGRLGKEVSNGLTYAQISDHTSTFSSPLEASRTDGGSGVCFNKYNSHDLRLLAYMPHRDDFEKEFMNDAESLISNLLFISDGKQVEHEAQLCLISMYISRLNERRKCKNLISEYDLISQFLKEQKPCGIHNYWKYSPADVRRMKEERELKEGFRRFCQFIPVSELEALISNLMKERAVKSRIEELQEYCKNGVTSLKGKREFDLNLTPRRRRLFISRRIGDCVSPVDKNGWLTASEDGTVHFEPEQFVRNRTIQPRSMV